MRVAGVVDLLEGRAVHAVAGDRARYAPIARIAEAPVPPGDPDALARAYRDRFGVTDLYCADLDAIRGGQPQTAAVAALAGLGLPLWLDAGITSGDAATHARALGAAHVVIGLETLPDFETLPRCCAAVGSAHVAFSLDLRDGRPLRRPADVPPSDDDPPALAARAAAAGASAVIVLDLARVGTRTGPDTALLARVRDAAPDVVLLAGGGIRDAADCVRLADAGCDGVLLATALLDGRVSAGDVAALVARPPAQRIRA